MRTCVAVTCWEAEAQPPADVGGILLITILNSNDRVTVRPGVLPSDGGSVIVTLELLAHCSARFTHGVNVGEFGTSANIFVQVFGLIPVVYGTFVFSHHSSVQLPCGPIAGYERAIETLKLCPIREGVSIRLILLIPMESVQQGQSARCSLKPEVSFGLVIRDLSTDVSKADGVSRLGRPESPVSDFVSGMMP